MISSTRIIKPSMSTAAVARRRTEPEPCEGEGCHSINSLPSSDSVCRSRACVCSWACRASGDGHITSCSLSPSGLPRANDGARLSVQRAYKAISPPVYSHSEAPPLPARVGQGQRRICASGTIWIQYGNPHLARKCRALHHAWRKKCTQNQQSTVQHHGPIASDVPTQGRLDLWAVPRWQAAHASQG